MVARPLSDQSLHAFVRLTLLHKLSSHNQRDLTDEWVLSQGVRLVVKLSNSTVETAFVGLCQLLSRLLLILDLLLKLRHVEQLCVYFAAPLHEHAALQFSPEGALFAVDALLEPRVGDTAPRFEEAQLLFSVDFVLVEVSDAGQLLLLALDQRPA